MPEGPEVRSVRDYLSRKLTNKTIKKIEILGGRYKTHDPPKNYKKIIKLLPLKVESVNVYGKFIWLTFKGTDLTMWNTLGMTGWWQSKEEKHNNISLVYDNNKKVYFNDYRNFGTLMFDSKLKLNQKLATFGPNIFNNDKDSLNKFINLVQKRNIPICELLLDQKIAAGCGNYLRADALYLAEINPFILGSLLAKDTLEELWKILNHLAWYYYNIDKGRRLKIINKNYKLADSFDRIFLIYSQNTDPFNNPVKRDVIKTRTIHWVPQIQNS